MANHPELSDRAQHLLKVLVERYIFDGQPVGSRALAREAGLNLSPASIRNVMADLEELGLITAPHTSAGRMPTVSGYRFFVDSLLTVRPLRQEVARQFQLDLDTSEDPDEVLEKASKLLADMTHMAGLVSMPRREAVIFRMIEFLPLSEQRILVILVTNEQEVQNRIIYPSRRFSASELTAAANYLNAVYGGMDLTAVRDSLVRDLRETRDRMNQEVINATEIGELALKGRKQRRKKDFVLAGETNLMDFGELASMNRLRALFSAFQQKEDMLHLLERCLETSGVKIFIGEESGYEALEQCSLVTASYAVDTNTVGVLGVIGPTRMEYERVIPLVDLTAKLLGATLNQKSLSPS
ncbi:MAG: hrcA [Proteobacteria bacterium]|nr:hrcA [Pseudomonadota bacterium]